MPAMTALAMRKLLHIILAAGHILTARQKVISTVLMAAVKAIGMLKLLQIILAAGHNLIAWQNVISTVLMPAVKALGTVSYTHLDVYKRQVVQYVM